LELKKKTTRASEDSADRKTIMLLNALGKVNSCNQKSGWQDLKAKGKEIKIGLLPEVALRFERRRFRNLPPITQRRC